MNFLPFKLKSITFGLVMIFVAIGCNKDDDASENNATDDCTNVTSKFTINLDATTCTVDIQNALGVNSSYNESVSGTTRTIIVNNIPSHKTGTFPNANNPNTIAAISKTYTVTTTPSAASSFTSSQGYEFGILKSGVSIDPYTAEFFVGTSGSTNMSWNYNALQTVRNLGADCNNAHVQPSGKYHYHGTPSAYISDLGTANGTQMIKVGYAADGFPIYYKYSYNDAGTAIVEYQSGYQIKSGSRGGNGSTAPSGCYDGTYFQDYEWITGTGLDQANGRTGKTPESASEYHYIITDNFPSSPIYFRGTPNASFRLF